MEKRKELIRVYRVLRGASGASGHARLQRQAGRSNMSLYARGLPPMARARVWAACPEDAYALCEARADGRGALRVELTDAEPWAKSPEAALIVTDTLGSPLLEGYDPRSDGASRARDRARAIAGDEGRRKRVSAPVERAPRYIAEPPREEAQPPAPQTEPPLSQAPAPAFEPPPLAQAPPEPLPRGVRIPALERPRGLAIDASDCRSVARDAARPPRPCDLPPPLKWSRELAPIKAYFDALPPCQPVEDAGWRFVRVPLPSGQGSFCVGIRPESDAVRGLMYLVPAPGDEPPPPSLRGYRQRIGADGQTYWTLTQRIGAE